MKNIFKTKTVLFSLLLGVIAVTPALAISTTATGVSSGVVSSQEANPPIIIVPITGGSIPPQSNPTATPTLTKGPIPPQPTPTCIPKPSCLDSHPACEIAEPVQGFCPPSPTESPIPPQPAPTCIPRPACLDSHPACEIAEPAQGFCPPTVTPTPTLQPVGPTVVINSLTTAVENIWKFITHII